MKAVILISLFVFVSCSHSVHLVNTSDYSIDVNQKYGKKISSLAEQKVVFWMAFETNYVEQAKSKLIAKCPKGDIKNITTRYSTSHGFFNWTNKIYMQGTCFN